MQLQNKLWIFVFFCLLLGSKAQKFTNLSESIDEIEKCYCNNSYYSKKSQKKHKSEKKSGKGMGIRKN